MVYVGGCSQNVGGSWEGDDRWSFVWTFAVVQERLVDAMTMLWRLPDRERGWLRAGVSSIWANYHETFGMNAVELAAWRNINADVPPALPGLTRDEVGEMEEALGWMVYVPTDDRKLVGLAITELARGHAQVSWMRLLHPMGLREGEDALRMRYGRAINRIVVALEAAEIRRSARQPG